MVINDLQPSLLACSRRIAPSKLKRRGSISSQSFSILASLTGKQTSRPSTCHTTTIAASTASSLAMVVVETTVANTSRADMAVAVTAVKNTADPRKVALVGLL